jgi:transposase
VLFLDETALMLQPLVRRTWAPRGRRPVLYCWDRHDRLSMIAGLTLSARYHHIGLYFAIHRQNITTEEVVAFVRKVQRQVRRPLIVILDRLPAHRSAAVRLKKDGRFSIEWLPSYAPEINPVEPNWSHSKYGELANYAPDDLLDLEIEAKLVLERTATDPGLLLSFFQAAELNLQL